VAATVSVLPETVAPPEPAPAPKREEDKDTFAYFLTRTKNDNEKNLLRLVVTVAGLMTQNDISKFWIGSESKAITTVPTTAYDALEIYVSPIISSKMQVELTYLTGGVGSLPRAFAKILSNGAARTHFANLVATNSSETRMKDAVGYPRKEALLLHQSARYAALDFFSRFL
jgi:hypothetical protein